MDIEKNRSFLSQLLGNHNEIMKILEEGDNAEQVYFGFSKAFKKCDTVIYFIKIKVYE